MKDYRMETSKLHELIIKAKTIGELSTYRRIAEEQLGRFNMTTREAERWLMLVEYAAYRTSLMIKYAHKMADRMPLPFPSMN